MSGRSILAAAILALCSAWLAAAQPINRIVGVVRDETGENLRGVIVRAETGGTTVAAPLTLTAVTDERGRFVFVVSRSGDWRMTFEAPGFDPMTIATSVRLTGATPNLDVRLNRHEAPEASGAMAGINAKQLSSQLASAEQMLDAGDHDGAIAAYQEILARAPALTLVNLQLGNAYLMKKAFPEAEAAFQEILKASGSDANGLFAMGSVREAEGDAAGAADWYTKASAADRLWTRPLMKLAALARQGGDHATASRYLAQVIEIDPSSADAIQAQALQNNSR